MRLSQSQITRCWRPPADGTIVVKRRRPWSWGSVCGASTLKDTALMTTDHLDISLNWGFQDILYILSTSASVFTWSVENTKLPAPFNHFVVRCLNRLLLCLFFFWRWRDNQMFWMKCGLNINVNITQKVDHELASVHIF